MRLRFIATLFISLTCVPLSHTFTPHVVALTLFTLQDGHVVPPLKRRPVWQRRHPNCERYVTEDDLHSLTNRVSVAEEMIAGLCNIILSADDVALSERNAVQMGPVYMDSSFGMHRMPILLRTETHDLMIKHSKTCKPLQRKWRLKQMASEENGG